MVGVDLSPAMLNRLVEKAGGVPFPVVIGDATALPFPDHLFGAAIAAHVFHLIPRWKAAVAELCRVVKPGGVILVSSAGARDWESEVSERFYAEAGAPAHPAPRPDVAAEMNRLGSAVRSLRSRKVRSERSLEDLIASLEAGHFSRTWRLAPEVRRQAGKATRRWARRVYGDISALRALEIEITWEAFDLPG